MRESKRGPVQKCSWTPEEDQILMNLVSIHGPKKWSLIAASLRGRIGKQCRERWHNHLNPEVRKDAWSPQEDALIFELVDKHGTKWATISKALPGRTDNSIKNRYYSSLKKFHEQRRQSTDSGPMKTPKPKRRKSLESNSSDGLLDTVSESCSEDASQMSNHNNDVATVEYSPKNTIGRLNKFTGIPNISHMFSLNSVISGQPSSMALMLPQTFPDEESQLARSIEVSEKKLLKARSVPQQRRLQPLHRVHSQELVHQALNINKLYEMQHQIARSTPVNEFTTESVNIETEMMVESSPEPILPEAQYLLEPLSLVSEYQILLHHF